MKLFIKIAFFAMLCIATTATAQVGMKYTSKNEITKSDTLVFAINDPIEFDGHYYNVQDSEDVTFNYVFTVERGVCIVDSKGIEYQVRKTQHKDCAILHIEIADPYWQQKLMQANKE
jgi:hypothetical protein